MREGQSKANDRPSQAWDRTLLVVGIILSAVTGLLGILALLVGWVVGVLGRGPFGAVSNPGARLLVGLGPLLLGLIYLTPVMVFRRRPWIVAYGLITLGAAFLVFGLTRSIAIDPSSAWPALLLLAAPVTAWVAQARLSLREAAGVGPQAWRAGAGAAAPVPETAIASLVLGLLGLLSCGVTAMVGLVLGVMALTRIRRSNGTVGGGRVAWAGTVVSALLLLLMPFLVLVGGSSAARGRANVQVTVCTAHLGQLAAGIRAYATENDDRLPKGADWCEAIQGHMRGAQAFRCPACPPGERCAYAFNAALSGVARATVAAPAETVLLFESAGGWNASGGLELVLARPRHPGGVGVAFADGHAEMVSPARLPSLRWTP